jgi:prepilin-type N-terminal cleavage/methylation domain-containing protein
MKDRQAGYTIPELLVALVLSGLFVGLILNFTISYWRYGYLLDADLDTLITRLNAGDLLRDSISTSSGLIVQNSISDVNAANVDPGNPGYWISIHAIPGNKPIGANGTTTPLVYYRRLSTNSSGAIIMNGVQPYEDEYVLYLDGTTKKMMLRSLANPAASGNKLKTSCPPASATASCPADKVVSSDLASVDTRYFSRTGNLIDYTSITDPVSGQYIGPDFTVVEVMELTLNLTKKPIFQQTNATQNSTIIRIALRNT